VPSHLPPAYGVYATPHGRPASDFHPRGTQLDEEGSVPDDEVLARVKGAASHQHAEAPTSATTQALEGPLAPRDMFAWLESSGAQGLRDAMVQIQLRRGEVLYTQGEYGDALYLIVSGVIKIVREDGGDRQHVLFLLGPGETCGEADVFGSAPRSSSAVAVTEATVFELSISDLMPFLTHSPDLALFFLHQLSSRMEHAARALSDLTVSDASTRVAKRLVELAALFGDPHTRGILVRHGLKQAELAQLVGTSRETVNRVLADFASQGWIETWFRALLITDMAALLERGRVPTASSTRTGPRPSATRRPEGRRSRS